MKRNKLDIVYFTQNNVLTNHTATFTWHDYDIESNYKFKEKPVQSRAQVYPMPKLA